MLMPKAAPTWLLWPLCCVMTFFVARHFLDQRSTVTTEVARSEANPVIPSDEDSQPETEVFIPAVTTTPVVASTPATAPTLPAAKATEEFVVQRLPQAQPSAPAQSVIPPSPSAARGSTSPNYFNPAYRPPVGEHYVQPHTRKDGTAVQGHYRTNPDDSFWNNYSSRGNVNPHTGQTGTRTPNSTYRIPPPPSLNIQPLRILPPLGGSKSSRGPGSR